MNNTNEEEDGQEKEDTSHINYMDDIVTYTAHA